MTHGTTNRHLPAGKITRRSMSTRLALMVSATAAVIFLLGTLLAYWRSHTPFTKRFEADLVAQTHLIKDVVEKFDNSSKHSALQLIGFLKGKFPSGITADPGRSVKVGVEDTLVLKAGAAVVNNDFAQVDAFTHEAGGKSVATIFVRQNNEFIRISTSLKKEDGSRAMGTRLDHKHPAYAALIESRDYTGKAHLFGRDYMTRYEPFTDKAGAVVGIYFIGFEISEPMRELKKLIHEIKIMKTGYAYVLDSTKDIANNIARASEGVKTAEEQVGQTATVSGSIAQEIASLSQAVSEIRAGGKQVESSATELHRLATHLGTLVTRFKT